MKDSKHECGNCGNSDYRSGSVFWGCGISRMDNRRTKIVLDNAPGLWYND